MQDSLPPILPIGTQVVARVDVRDSTGRARLPAGSVGRIVQSPSDYWHAYRIAFIDGFEASLRRDEVAVVSRFKDAAIDPADAMGERGLWECVILKVVIGSRAYGLDDDQSDTDIRGVYLPPADMDWSVYGVPEQLENPETEEVYWELRKFIILALKASPNILEVLYSPMVLHATDLARELIAIRGIFLSRLVYQTYNGYVMSQFRKLQSDLRIHGQVKWKHAMHLVRLLLSGIGTLRKGEVPVSAGEQRERLLQIKRGELPFEEVDQWRLMLHHQFEEAYSSTTLPERPDYVAANAFLIKARRSMV